MPNLWNRYLASEFYARNYSLTHRFEMLEVISAASVELSTITAPQPQAVAEPDARSRPVTITLDDAEARRRSAEAIIQKRLEAKTRRFHSPAPTPAASRANTFATFVGEYYYPLLNGIDTPLEYLDLMERDSMVLAQVVQTLGAVLFSAGASLSTARMAVPLLEVLLMLRNHSEGHVRRAVRPPKPL